MNREDPTGALSMTKDTLAESQRMSEAIKMRESATAESVILSLIDVDEAKRATITTRIAFGREILDKIRGVQRG